MYSINFDNLNQFSFTPRDFQTELLAAAIERNIIACLSQNTAKEFVALKLIQELGFELRRNKNRKITIYLSSSITAFHLLQHLTNLKVIDLNRSNDVDWETVFLDNQVIILDPRRCIDALTCFYLDLESVNLIVVDDCHTKSQKNHISKIFFEYYTKTTVKPKIFGLAGPIHNAGCPSARLGAELEHLELILQAKAETASDIVTVLRYSPKPKELIVECSVPKNDVVTNYLRNLILSRKAFITDHQYDPSNIYSEFEEEVQAMKDPKSEPLKYLNEFLNILNELGPYCADKAAITLLHQIEKRKEKVPYEHHFLILCLVSTTLIQIRSHCDSVFRELKSDKEKLETYSSPKLLRILDVVKQFKPDKGGKTIDKKKSSEVSEIKCNSEACINLINEIETSSLDILMTTTSENINHISDTLDSLKLSVTKIKTESLCAVPSSLITAKNLNLRPFTRFRNRKRFYPRPYNGRRNFQSNSEGDALCGVVFCNSTLTAKVLFGIFCEASRFDPELKFLNVQYTVGKTADPLTDHKEAQNEHRKQEEVLKKFRMHECNLLISTPVLEEGFDLPKCNLIIRWDPPSTYRSYVQCKGRARAPNAVHVILIAPEIKELVHEDKHGEDISNASHSYICNFNRKRIASETSLDTDKSEKVEDSSPDSDDEEDLPPISSCSAEDQSNIPDNLYSNVEDCTNNMIETLAEYMEIEKMLIRNCENKEPKYEELIQAEKFTSLIKPHKPLNSTDGVSVNLSTAISLVNKYCAKLPSDTFTKLTPIWRCCKTVRNGFTLFQYTLRLPINSPMKHDILGLPMPTQTLAKRVAALVACRTLHRSGELDDNLQPIGKEGFRAYEADWENFELEKSDEKIVQDNSEPRPGTTKRRQYYYKRIAAAFTNCRPTTIIHAFLYHITMTLQCPIPEEQNTRGRKIYPPEDATQSFGILTTKKIPKISSFPIFTRSGEVRVSLRLIRSDVLLSEEQVENINIFINYTFTNVLRLRKYLMLFDPEATENSFFVVPVLSEKQEYVRVDWKFLELIKLNVNMVPDFVSEEQRKTQNFDYNRFKDAVVMPWYRNQDQPQYFYVAEICYPLNPDSIFPGENYSTFKEYYFKKYSIEIQNKRQPLLDVDHTSARLNFLTPRYVNRKGVALPTSSEETKRAKRENLEQKQILVPELCTVHPFPASLWRAAVCLPCILYRINALLLADEIRMEVSFDLGLGQMEILDDDFDWPTLDFGWTLADVLMKTREAKRKDVDEANLLAIANGEHNKDSNEDPIEDSKDESFEENQILILAEVAEQKQRKEMLEIGTWSNEMAADIDDEEFYRELDILPENLPMCSRSVLNVRYSTPVSYSDSEISDDSIETNSIDNMNQLDEFGFKIEFKTDHLAEAVETQEEIERHQRKIELMNQDILSKQQYELAKNQTSGFDFIDEHNNHNLEENIKQHELEFNRSTAELKQMIRDSGILVKQNDQFQLKPKSVTVEKLEQLSEEAVNVFDLFPYLKKNEILIVVENRKEPIVSLDNLFELNDIYTQKNPLEKFQVVGSGDIFDKFADCDHLSLSDSGNREITLNIRDLMKFESKLDSIEPSPFDEPKIPDRSGDQFSFDMQPNLTNHPGPSPSIILQALTMSNANDGINLERLETIGDSFLKYAITTYLYCTYENVHEGKLSHLRSKQVSNLNLYRLGRKKILGESMIATKFEPHDNWLPPCYYVPKELEQALIDAKIPACYWNLADLPNIKKLSSDEICKLVKERAESLGLLEENTDNDLDESTIPLPVEPLTTDKHPCFIPYNLVTQHSIPDKSIADCVEALIGAYLIDCGPRGALLFMAWLGIRVLPIKEIISDDSKRVPGSTREYSKDGTMVQTVYGHWVAPKSPLLHCTPTPFETLELLLDGFTAFEETLGYRFRDQSYLLQAMTHASYSPNRLTDCYQRLEFLGDAVLDYLITRHLYEDPRQHSPGALTDLRSALVNNTIFASLAVRHGFHKYFRHLSPGLNDVIDRFVRIQHENGHSISEEYYLLGEDECDEAEDVEVPKSLGDVFESVAGAIFLDSNMSLDCVWRVYNNMMGPEIEQFSCSVPKSPIRELLELEPETAKFGKPEKLADGRRVRVTVEVFGKGTFRGVGRNYRIAKCTAAKCALRQLKKMGLINKRH